MTMRSAAIYARFSSDKQQDRSIDDQIALCRQVAEREGLTIAGVYDDRAISGASIANRLGFQRLMRDATAGKFKIVIAEALDRLSRDQEDLAGIYKRLKFAGVAILTAQDGVAGDIHIGVKGMLGALYLKDLADKTRRGQAGVLRDGRHNGGRSFGYRQTTGSQAGSLEIVPAEAETVRAIFNRYIAGESPRHIAAGLNRDGIAGPRGNIWNASTIAGSRIRRNGILQNELYAGRIVWNRQRFIKDPATGKRVSRPNPQADWMTADAEHLRIIDQVTWEKVQSRKADRGGERPSQRKPKHLLSGLIRCGCCGSSYIVTGSDRRGGVLSCSRMKETGTCDNRRTIARDVIEQRVFEALEKQLADPELIALYVREFHSAMREIELRNAKDNRQVERKLSDVNAAIARLVDALISGTPARAVSERLAALEAERDDLERQRDASAAPAISLHPNAAEEYRRKVAGLKATIAAMTDDTRDDALAAIRELIEKIVLHPQGKARPIEIEIHGQLATMLDMSRGGLSVGPVVAGTRNNITHRHCPPLVLRARSA